MSKKLQFALIRQTLTVSNGWCSDVKGVYKSESEARAELADYIEYIKGEDPRAAVRELEPYKGSMIARVGYLAKDYIFPMGQFLIVKIPAL